MTIPKICLFCEYFVFTNGLVEYSEYTPGDSAEMRCMLGHWQYDFNLNDLIDIMATAQNCRSFAIDPWAAKRFNLTEEKPNV